MCGLAAIIAFDGSNVEKERLLWMTNSIRHRGPDDEGIYLNGSVAFGFRRLSILDLSPSGHQPMCDVTGGVVIVFNGEIYNYLELRKELVSRGYKFRSNGDTEVLLNAYLEWGIDCLQRFNGMWAFLIHDTRRNLVFGSRDRFGIKPLYYSRRSKLMIFGSEIKCIRASKVSEYEINWTTAASFLCYGHLDRSTKTFYTDIEQVPPGTAFTVNMEGQYRSWRYWNLEPSKTDIDDPARAFAELFEDAVRLHMRSDVPVGVHLSGGLDSTSIACASARIRRASNAQGPLKAFCFMAPQFDETRYISDTLQKTQAQLVQLSITPRELWDLLPEVLRFQDEPVHSITAIVGYALMRLSRQHSVPVILNGQGADETLGGYPNYFLQYWTDLIRAGAFQSAWQQVSEFAQAKDQNACKLLFRAMRHWAQGNMRRYSAYRRVSRWRQKLRAGSQTWLSDSLLENIPDSVGANGANNLTSSLHNSVYISPLPYELRVEDRNSMAHSVEVRLPFLDYRVVAFAWDLPSEWKLRGPWNKYLLRLAMKNKIPHSVRTRVDKMGFPTPVREWFANDLYVPMKDMLASRAVRERGIYNVRAIEKDLKRHREGHIDVASRLFDIAQIEALLGN